MLHVGLDMHKRFSVVTVIDSETSPRLRSIPCNYGHLVALRAYAQDRLLNQTS